MRFLMMSALVLGAFFLTACGGGGSPVLETAALSGTIVQVDGQTLNRAGVTVELVENGAVVTTDGTGAFAFPDLSPGVFTLRFGRAGLAGNSTDDNGTPDQGPGDNAIGSIPVGAGDDVDVKVAVDGNNATEVSISRNGRREARVRLTRAADSPDADVSGKIKVRSGNGEKLEIEAEDLAPGDVVEFLLDGIVIGSAAADADGEAELEIETNDGGLLPLEAATVADLEGLSVEVRFMDGGATLLTGTVPELPAASTANGDDDDNSGSGNDGDGGGDDGDRTRGRDRLTSHVGALEGHVETRSRPEQSRERFKVEAENLGAGEIVEFFLDGVSLGKIAADASGEAEFKRDTQDGDVLPSGAATSGTLVGLLVEVKRDGTGELLLSGLVPEPVAD